MIITLGVEKNVSNYTVVGDTDSLIALALEDDHNHQVAERIVTSLKEQRAIIIYPVTVFPEAVTSLKRAANQPLKAHLLNKQYLAGKFQVEYINEEIMKTAAEIFDKKAVSKQNTLFDAIVAATAEYLGADTIFSFDSWYKKLGFKLAGN